MTGQYLGNDLQWRPIATVSGGGPAEKLPLDASGAASSTAIIRVDERIWDHLEPYAGGTSLARGFYGLVSIAGVPLFDTSNVTNMSYMFYGCSSLVEIPLFDTSSVTNMSYMFRECGSLAEIPPLDTSNATNMRDMFGNCTSLVEIPSLDTSNATNMRSMFSGCSSLTEIPGLDMSAATDLALFAGSVSIASQLSSLTRFKAFGATRGFDLMGTSMDAAALNELMSNLGTANGSQTLRISGNPGSATCDPSIATAKGWTVLR